MHSEFRYIRPEVNKSTVPKSKSDMHSEFRYIRPEVKELKWMHMNNLPNLFKCAEDDFSSRPTYTSYFHLHPS
jgi:hypothetical protein